MSPGANDLMLHGPHTGVPGVPSRGPADASAAAAVPMAQLLPLAQRFLADQGPGDLSLEHAWNAFHEYCTARIRNFAFRCGATPQDVDDCVQETWAELLVRLPGFRLDPARGRFDTWLFRIVRGKIADQRRARRRLRQDSPEAFLALADAHPSPALALEDAELVRLAFDRLRSRLDGSNLELFTQRLLEDRPVAEVALRFGLSHEQVWYRLHRARRAVERIGVDLERGNRLESPAAEKTKTRKDSAQGEGPVSVSRIVSNVSPVSLSRPGGPGVDYLFQKLELGRRELTPEWKVEWVFGEPVPRAELYIRKLALVAYAEFCGAEEFLRENWTTIAGAALAAGVAAGIATIIATPSAALPVFRMEFHRQLLPRSGNDAERIQVALSAREEANGPWVECKR